MMETLRASSGIGEATARHLASLGAVVVLGACRTDRLDRLVAEIDIPVYLQIDQGRGWTVDGTIELIGTGAAHLFAEIDQDDTNFILRLWDETPDGTRQLITSGYLEASHRELDERSIEGDP